jgi:hypothetical protein
MHGSRIQLCKQSSPTVVKPAFRLSCGIGGELGKAARFPSLTWGTQLFARWHRSSQR